MPGKTCEKCHKPYSGFGTTCSECRKIKSNGEGKSAGDGNDNKCISCGKTAYVMEQLKVEGVLFHQACFKCVYCNQKLSTGNFERSNEGKFYCKVHYSQIFGRGGRLSIVSTHDTALLWQPLTETPKEVATLANMPAEAPAATPEPAAPPAPAASPDGKPAAAPPAEEPAAAPPAGEPASPPKGEAEAEAASPPEAPAVEPAPPPGDSAAGKQASAPEAPAEESAPAVDATPKESTAGEAS